MLHKGYVVAKLGLEIAHKVSPAQAEQFQLLYDTFLHLVGGGVSERDSQQMLVIVPASFDQHVLVAVFAT